QPESVPATRNLARMLLGSGQPDEAAQALRDLLAKKPNDVNVLLGLAEVAVAQQKWDQALDLLKQAQAAAGNNPQPGIALANFYLLRGDTASAKAITDKLAAEFLSNAEVLEVQARAQLAAGDNKGALASFRRAYQLAPRSGPIMSRYVSLLIEAKNFAEARTVLQDAVDRSPTNAGLRVDLIRVTAQAGGLEAAVTKARSFAAADPNTPLYDLLSAELYEQAGRNDEARALLEKTVAARPAD